ncbi:MAG: stage II sporulation protein R [Clostridia bacterium]|nr:stage II sporulation protein R [Clostridia bacterium]
MRIIATVLISMATFFVLNAVIPTKAECEIYDSCVRLHILANSDSEKDQSLKLKVRDKMLEKISSYELKSKGEALSKIEDDKDELIEIAKEVIKENGEEYDVDLEIGVEKYPTRYYEDFSLPAGKYTSVIVKIGEAEGENWWCVLYPPLCTSAAIKADKDACIDVGLTKDQYNLITQSSGKYKVKFKILEVAANALGIEY